MKHPCTDKLKIWINNHNGCIKKADICYCHADGSYSRLFLKTGEVYLVSKTLKWLEDQLGGRCFFRCHRSYLINLLEVKWIDIEGKTAHQKLYQIPVSDSKLVKLLCKLNAHKLFEKKVYFKQ